MYYDGCKVLLRSNMKIATVVRKLPNNDKYLICYYNDSNELKYQIVDTDYDIILEDEYEIIRNRINTINKLL